MNMRRRHNPGTSGGQRRQHGHKYPRTGDDGQGHHSRPRQGRNAMAARNGAEMRGHLREVLNDSQLAEALAASGLETILARHTCRHRADELFAILAACGNRGATEIKPATEAAA